MSSLTIEFGGKITKDKAKLLKKALDGYVYFQVFGTCLERSYENDYDTVEEAIDCPVIDIDSDYVEKGLPELKKALQDQKVRFKITFENCVDPEYSFMEFWKPGMKKIVKTYPDISWRMKYIV
jgi:hypothetical protein